MQEKVLMKGDFKYVIETSEKVKKSSTASSSLNSSNENFVKIVDYIGEGKTVVLPNEIDGMSVISIGGGAFENKRIKNLKLNDQIIYIGKGAFKENDIEILELPNSLEKIGDFAFKNNNIKLLKFSGSLEEIGDSAFVNNPIKVLVFPERFEHSLKKMLSSDRYPTEILIGNTLFSRYLYTCIGIDEYSFNRIKKVAVIGEEKTNHSLNKLAEDINLTIEYVDEKMYQRLKKISELLI